MADHLRRIREHLALEARALALEAERARLFDHNGNRGSEAEQSILRWLRARFAPGYTVSSGEIIDSFDTNGDLASRQQDGILHRSDPEANRFLLPSGMRLVPIETVAAVVEVKLTLTKEEFEKSDRVAAETARLRLRGGPGSYVTTDADPGGGWSHQHGLSTEQLRDGFAVENLALVAKPAFAIFAFTGIKEIETIAGWLRSARMIDLVCCLEAGCALRGAKTCTGHRLSILSQSEHALSRFAECLAGAIKRHENHWQVYKADFSGYAAIETLTFWDETDSYDPPDWYKPDPQENATRERLYEARPALRRRGQDEEKGDVPAGTAVDPGTEGESKAGHA